MTIRFNGFTPGIGADRLCDVEIAYNKPLLQGPMVMWQNRVALGPVQGTGLSTDVGINTIQPAPPVGAASPTRRSGWRRSGRTTSTRCSRAPTRSALSPPRT